MRLGDMFVGNKVSCLKGAANSALPEHWEKVKSHYCLVLPLWVGRFDVILVINMLFLLQYCSVRLVEC